MLTPGMALCVEVEADDDEEDPDEVPRISYQECKGVNGDSDAWYDQTHNFLSEIFCEPALWFDSFFESDRIDEEVRPGTRVRWRNDFIYTEGGELEYVTDLKASFRLPKAKNKLRLVFESDQEETVEDVVPENKEELKGDVSLLYETYHSPRSNFTIRLRAKPKIILRYRYSYPVSQSFNIRFTQEGFRERTFDGGTTRLDFEKYFGKHFVLRWSTAATVQDNTEGKDWESSLVLYQHIDDKSALSYESSVTGFTKPAYTEDNYRLAVRYRRNIYRKWLFYELVPEVTWPLEYYVDSMGNTIYTDERKSVPAFMFRLEVNFESL